MRFAAAKLGLADTFRLSPFPFSDDGRDALRLGMKLFSGPYAEAALEVREVGRRGGWPGETDRALQLGGRIRW